MTELSSIQLLIATVAVILLTLISIAAFSYKAMKASSATRSALWAESMADKDKRVLALHVEIDEARRKNLTLGRLTHGFYLSLGALIVGSSALSAILALGFDEAQAPRGLVGAIALIPGICAGVADRFHLVLKKHWYYRKYDKLNALARRMAFIIPPFVTEEEITKVATDLCTIDRNMSRAWEQLEEEHPTANPEGKK